MFQYHCGERARFYTYSSVWILLWSRLLKPSRRSGSWYPRSSRGSWISFLQETLFREFETIMRKTIRRMSECTAARRLFSVGKGRLFLLSLLIPPSKEWKIRFDGGWKCREEGGEKKKKHIQFTIVALKKNRTTYLGSYPDLCCSQITSIDFSGVIQDLHWCDWDGHLDF